MLAIQSAVLIYEDSQRIVNHRRENNVSSYKVKAFIKQLKAEILVSSDRDAERENGQEIYHIEEQACKSINN